MENPVQSIFDYTDYRKFLADRYAREKQRNRNFSHRYISMAVGSSSAGWFSDLVKGRLNLTGAYLIKLIQVLGLESQEAQYFEGMVQYAQAASFEDRSRFFERMMSMRQPKTDLLGQDKFEYYSKWYYSAIRELLFIHDFQGDYAALGRVLSPPIRAKQAREAIALLERLELIRPDGNGRHRPSVPVLRKDTSAKAEHLFRYLRSQMELAMEALERHRPEERDISSLSLVLSRADFLRAKEEIRALRKRLLAWSEKPKGGERVFQCNFQMFPISE